MDGRVRGARLVWRNPFRVYRQRAVYTVRRIPRGDAPDPGTMAATPPVEADVDIVADKEVDSCGKRGGTPAL